MDKCFVYIASSPRFSVLHMEGASSQSYFHVIYSSTVSVGLTQACPKYIIYIDNVSDHLNIYTMWLKVYTVILELCAWVDSYYITINTCKAEYHLLHLLNQSFSSNSVVHACIVYKIKECLSCIIVVSHFMHAVNAHHA